MSLESRLQIFVEAGLLDRVPTRWQLLQAEIEMTPYVVSTDATAEEGYRDHLASHPLIRQLRLFRHVGLDHLRTGSALGARLESVCAHLILTFHRGMPVFDLQVIQTHERGLEHLRSAIQQALDRSTPLGKRRRAIADVLLRDPVGYLEQLLEHVARAERFDYPTPDVEGSSFPREFFSLVELAAYAATLPTDYARLPQRVIRLASRRARELGWRSGSPSRPPAFL